PLFDPTSDYGQLHASGRPDLRMRGYLHWLAARADRMQLAPYVASSRPQRERQALARLLAEATPQEPSGAIEVLEVIAAETHVLYVGDLEDSPGPAVGRLELCLLSQANGSRCVAAVIEGARGVARVPCVWRAFLFEPEVISRLEVALG